MANLHEFIPPAFADQIASWNIAMFILLKDIGSEETKYTEQRVIVEVVYEYIG